MRTIKTSWGNPTISDYDQVLDYYSGTKLNSLKTSSIPLAQYWQDANHALEVLKSKVGIEDEDVGIYFEYPTKSYARNKSSMSDIMIITSNNKIAIEAKYTEYEKTVYESIKTWYLKNETDNRLSVLSHWKNMIKNYSCGEFNKNSELAYQFLHRTASACYENPKNAYVLYQLFWDNNTVDKLYSFINQIRDYIRIINPNKNLKYVLHKIQVNKMNATNINTVFQDMKKNKIYEFGNEEIELV